ncbi:hypothetical protein CR513_17793, partial [Mucuna pruriens]
MWGINVNGPIEPKVSNRHRFILVAIDYFTKWVEAASYPTVTCNMVVWFIKKNIICRYGLPGHITTNNGANLNNKNTLPKSSGRGRTGRGRVGLAAARPAELY